MMAFFLGCDPPAAFLSLLGATIIWGPAGIIYGLPATFLQVSCYFRAKHAIISFVADSYP